MKTNFVKNYKKLLVIWIACGILVSGWFYLFPVLHTERHSTVDYPDLDPFGSGKAVYGISEYRVKGKHYQVSVLVTVVGAILIGGLGYTSKTKE